jgi:type IV secretory pathway VirB4 component
MADKQQPTKPSQEFVEVAAIKDGVVRLKNKGLRQILIVSGINFDLKSEDEQNLILDGFQNFINSLDFAVQFFVHSRKVNVEKYLALMEGRKNEETNELLKIQVDEYINFIRNFVEQNAIITKTFFTVVPYDPVIIPGGGSKGLMSFFSGNKASAKAAAEATIQENLEQLRRRTEQVIAGLNQIGLRAVPLEDDDLTELFYNLYNPQLVEKKELKLNK